LVASARDYSCSEWSFDVKIMSFSTFPYLDLQCIKSIIMCQPYISIVLTETLAGESETLSGVLAVEVAVVALGVDILLVAIDTVSFVLLIVRLVTVS